MGVVSVLLCVNADGDSESEKISDVALEGLIE